MNSIAILFLGAACGYLSGNPNARNTTLKQLQKLTGMAIDGLNKQGGNYVPKTDETIKQPEQPND